MTTHNNRPTHYVYAVRPSTKPGGKAFWTRIGAAWANRNGEGFSVSLDLVPINGSEIVIRTPREGRDEGVPHEAPHPEAVRDAPGPRPPSGGR